MIRSNIKGKYIWDIYIYINEYYVYRYRVIGYILCSKIQLKFNLCIKKMKIYMR